VEPDLQLIVGQTVVDATNDKQQLIPMIGIMEEQSGQRPKEVLADSGYCSEKNLEQLEASDKPEDRIIGYVATERQKHDEYRTPCRADPYQRMRPSGSHEAETEDQSRQGGVRGAQDHSGTGIRQIKHARGFRQFLMRGIDKVRGEWALVCLTHNILKIHRLCYA